MAKNAPPKDGDNALKITFGVPKGFSRKPPEAEKKIAVPEPVPVSAKDAAARIKNLGKGWDEEVEKLFAFPDELLMLEGEGWLSFSKEKDFGASWVAEEIGRKGTFRKPETAYGISVFETSSTIYLVLVDMERRVVIRHAVQRLHDSPPEKDWADFKSALKSGIEVAKGNKGIIAYFDGVMKQVRIEG